MSLVLRFALKSIPHYYVYAIPKEIDYGVK
jgi:hypothetical protein